MRTVCIRHFDLPFVREILRCSRILFPFSWFCVGGILFLSPVLCWHWFILFRVQGVLNIYIPLTRLKLCCSPFLHINLLVPHVVFPINFDGASSHVAP